MEHNLTLIRPHIFCVPGLVWVAVEVSVSAVARWSVLVPTSPPWRQCEKNIWKSKETRRNWSGPALRKRCAHLVRVPFGSCPVLLWMTFLNLTVTLVGFIHWPGLTTEVAILLPVPPRNVVDGRIRRTRQLRHWCGGPSSRARAHDLVVLVLWGSIQW